MKRPFEIQRALDRLKKRIVRTAEEARLVAHNLKNGKANGTVEFALRDLPPLLEFIETLETRIQPNLQKELGEALIAAVKLFEKMDKSELSLKRILTILNFLYNQRKPDISVFVSPPSVHGFGYKPNARLDTHLRVEEGLERHQDDFTSDMVADFDKAKEAGLELREAWESFKKEESESAVVIKDCLDILPEYGKLKRKIRNMLKGELENPSDAYLYVPKRK